MTLSRTAQRLADLLAEGFRQIGEIHIKVDVGGARFALLHHVDAEQLGTDGGWGELEVHRGPSAARALATFAADGSYRFTLVELNLRRGWVMLLETEDELRLALDQFYPACVGLFAAWRDGTLEVEPLREKLRRQTGMYRFTNQISDSGAQQLVERVCGPSNRCARRILWQIDDQTPLEDNEATRYRGVVGDEAKSIPLLCREACNHFVAETRKASQAEAKLRSGNPA